MKTINDYQHPSLDNLENERQHWYLIDPQLQGRRLNRLLKHPDIQQAYSEAALGYDSIERWECLEGSDFTRFPKWRLQLREGTQHFLPMDSERSDWRFMAYGRGRPPLFHSYVCMRACHWLALPNLLLARALYPDLHWVVMSAQFHTTVACLDERLLFDLNYAPSALNVSASEAIAMLLKGDEGLEVFDDEAGHPYVMTAKTDAAVEFFGLADGTHTPHEELLAGFRETLADAEVDELELIAC